MKTLASKLVLASCLCTLSACLTSPGSPKPDLSNSALFSKARAVPSADLVTNLDVRGGAVSLAGPKGYCVDSSAVLDRGSSAFVPFGACSALTKNPADPAPKTPAFLTASVTPLPPETALLPEGKAERLSAARAFLESRAGRAALSRSGNADSVSLLDTKVARDTLYIQLKETGPVLSPALTGVSWRALFELNETLVTATVSDFQDEPLSKNSGFSILRGFVSAIRSANPKAKTGQTGIAGLFENLR